MWLPCPARLATHEFDRRETPSPSRANVYITPPTLPSVDYGVLVLGQYLGTFLAVQVSISIGRGEHTSMLLMPSSQPFMSPKSSRNTTVS